MVNRLNELEHRHAAANAEISELKAALLDALGWNWLDEDAPSDLLNKYHDMAARPGDEDG